VNPEESAYWDAQAHERAVLRQRDNIWKRERICERLFRESWIDERVLEIGTGLGTAAAAVQAAILGKWVYTGTDVSATFCQQAKKYFGFHVEHTDILALPRTEGGWTRVWAFDSLEHIRPEDRELGWDELAEVMAPECRITINMPLDDNSQHDKRFDHPFGLGDLERIMDHTGCDLRLYEPYSVRGLHYAWVVLGR
jgi:SAM-dependent methyltransferase